MGMYTSLVISARLRESTPVLVIDTLRALAAGEMSIREVTGCDSNRSPLSGTSSYFPEASCSLKSTKYPDGHTLNAVASIKNYEDEIESFLDYLEPYVESGHGIREWWALVTYEEAENPTIRYLRGKDDEYDGIDLASVEPEA